MSFSHLKINYLSAFLSFYLCFNNLIFNYLKQAAQEKTYFQKTPGIHTC